MSTPEGEGPGRTKGEGEGSTQGREVYGFHNRYRHCWRKRSAEGKDVEECMKPVCEAEGALSRSYWLPRVIT